MKTSKYILLAAAIVLMAGLVAGVMAQGKITSRDSGVFLPPEPILPVTKVNAIEVTDGTIGMDNQTKKETMFGYSFLGRTTGAYPGSFTLSMNCAPAIPVPGESSDVTGGAWTLPVYMPSVRGSYAGSLYGTIAKGTMNWDKTGTNADVFFILNVDGGTQAWGGTQGYATFAGTLFVDEKTQETMLTGDMVFTILSGVVDK
jgi:hypothetical protein